jgi:hypothetical protein
MPNTAGYQRQYRKDNPDYVNKQRKRDQARGKALRALAANHLTEFDKLFNKFLGEMGESDSGTKHSPTSLPQRNQ